MCLPWDMSHPLSKCPKLDFRLDRRVQSYKRYKHPSTKMASVSVVEMKDTETEKLGTNTEDLREDEKDLPQHRHK